MNNKLEKEINKLETKLTKNRFLKKIGYIVFFAVCGLCFFVAFTLAFTALMMP